VLPATINVDAGAGEMTAARCLCAGTRPDRQSHYDWRWHYDWQLHQVMSALRSEMASVGQMLMQLPQRMHSSELIQM